jgi:hypothetical protein
MDHGIAPVRGRGEGVAVAHVTDDRLAEHARVSIRHQCGGPPAEHHRCVSSRDQGANDGSPEKPCAAGNEYSHDVPSVATIDSNVGTPNEWVSGVYVVRVPRWRE